MGLKERSAEVMHGKVLKWLEECEAKGQDPMSEIIVMQSTRRYLQKVKTSARAEVLNSELLSISGLAWVGAHAVVEHLLEIGALSPEDVDLAE